MAATDKPIPVNQPIVYVLYPALHDFDIGLLLSIGMSSCPEQAVLF